MEETHNYSSWSKKTAVLVHFLLTDNVRGGASNLYWSVDCSPLRTPSSRKQSDRDCGFPHSGPVGNGHDQFWWPAKEVMNHKHFSRYKTKNLFLATVSQLVTFGFWKLQIDDLQLPIFQGWHSSIGLMNDEAAIAGWGRQCWLKLPMLELASRSWCNQWRVTRYTVQSLTKVFIFSQEHFVLFQEFHWLDDSFFQ